MTANEEKVAYEIIKNIIEDSQKSNLDPIYALQIAEREVRKIRLNLKYPPVKGLYGE